MKSNNFDVTKTHTHVVLHVPISNTRTPIYIYYFLTNNDPCFLEEEEETNDNSSNHTSHYVQCACSSLFLPRIFPEIFRIVQGKLSLFNSGQNFHWLKCQDILKNKLYSHLCAVWRLYV